jgi:surface protein
MWLNDEAQCLELYGHISDWDVSNVTNMKEMFSGAESFNQPIGDWDVSSVTDMSYMFKSSYFKHTFNQPLENWDVSNVKYMTVRVPKNWNLVYSLLAPDASIITLTSTPLLCASISAPATPL